MKVCVNGSGSVVYSGGQDATR